jgi:hypothetical protein
VRVSRGLVGALVAAVSAAIVAVGGAASSAPAGEPLSVSDATLAWGLSNQSNARSHNPIAINFLSAGVADPGSGGIELPQSKWRARDGNVQVQKLDADSTWQRATWAGLGSDASGAAIGIDGPFSGHRVLLSAGEGTVDPASKTVDLSWRGTFSVVYYGGNIVFTVTDPALQVGDGTGSLTANVAGWASDRSDPTAWTPQPAERVTLADLTGVVVSDAGFTVTPAYDGVTVEGSVPQVRTGPGWGSFPTSLVSYLAKLGSDQFWYSTGLTSDHTKAPLPLTLGFGDQAPTTTPSPTASATTTPTTRATPTNPVLTPPSNRPAPAVVTHTVTAAPVAPAPAVAAPVPQVAAAAPAAPLPAPAVVLAASTPTTQAAVAERDSADVGWWAGGALLLAAAVLILLRTFTARS